MSAENKKIKSNDWTYKHCAIHDMSYKELKEIHTLFDWELNFPNYGYVCLDTFVNILKDCNCFFIYLNGTIAGMLYFEPMRKCCCKFHFAVLRHELIRNRGYIRVVNGILDMLLDKSNKLCYKCIYGYTPYDNIVRFSKLFGFRFKRTEGVFSVLIRDTKHKTHKL
jgi:hypothetical protein